MLYIADDCIASEQSLICVVGLAVVVSVLLVLIMLGLIGVGIFMKRSMADTQVSNHPDSGVARGGMGACPPSP